MKGQTVAVVGASSGIGLATCQVAAELGATVVMLSRSIEKLESAAKTIKGQTRCIAVDMLDPASVERTFSDLGNLDHLVLTAVADENKKRGAFTTLDLQTAQSSFDKFWGYFNLLQSALPCLNSKGTITLLSGASAFKPGNGMSILAATNAAVVTLGLALAKELAPIRVNVVSPGAVDTGVWSESERESLQKWMKESLPARAVGRPEDIAQGILYLMMNPYSTGTVLHIDGGLSLT